MNLLSLLTLRRNTPASRKPATAAADATQRDELPGCGWFDSSHDLHRGLCVQEHASPETLARELPLASWLELQLASWRAPQSLQA
jgi:hypothetical protein